MCGAAGGGGGGGAGPGHLESSRLPYLTLIYIIAIILFFTNSNTTFLSSVVFPPLVFLSNEILHNFSTYGATTSRATSSRTNGTSFPLLYLDPMR